VKKIEPSYSPDGKKRGGAVAVILGGPLIMDSVRFFQNLIIEN
jgi:hypothetical protein